MRQSPPAQSLALRHPQQALNNLMPLLYPNPQGQLLPHPSPPPELFYPAPEPVQLELFPWHRARSPWQHPPATRE